MKFTYQEQKDWETIEDDIAALEDKAGQLDTEIEEAASNYARLEQLMAEKETIEAELEAKMERWVYLNNLAERIASQK